MQRQDRELQQHRHKQIHHSEEELRMIQQVLRRLLVLNS
jgi:hypothetical protein